MPQPMRILFAGAGEFGLPTLQALRAAGHEILLVISQPDRPAGRGRKTIPTPIAQYALAENLPLLRTGDINREVLPSADAMVVIAFGQKLAAAITNTPRFGSINLHASLLPKCRGAAPINWTIIRGETLAGNSIIRLAEKMDAGAILAQSQRPIGEVQTAGEIHDLLAQDGAPLVLDTLAQLAAGTAREVPQDHSQATLAPKLGRQDTLLDLSSSAPALANRIRGLYPWPGCRVILKDAAGGELGRVTLVRVRPTRGEGARWSPGEITTEGAISLGNGEEALQIVALQPEGRTVMELSAYRNGNPWTAGMRVESVA